ncbi:MAG TPA: hypothetical protein VH279_14630 [Solirubrobacteraceae bacterium]|nr:hypothetical protein [Solirubrobacteraceae bacterium]
MRSRRSAAAATAAALAASLALAAQAFGLPPFSTAPKTSTGSGGQAQLSGIDTGCHATFDRFVIRVGSGNPGYDVRYVARIVADPSGNPVSLQGGKKIKVVIRPARGHTTGGTNLLPATLTPLCSNLRQVKRVGDFEGVVSFGLGVARRTGFRVFRLSGPTRIVVDVAH